MSRAGNSPRDAAERRCACRTLKALGLTALAATLPAVLEQARAAAAHVCDLPARGSGGGTDGSRRTGAGSAAAHARVCRRARRWRASTSAFSPACPSD